jgi:hypothetical protein
MSTRPSYLLWLLTALLTLRVVGQFLVVLFKPTWLPPMNQWQSGLVPYRVLLPCQIVVLILMSWAAADFSRGSGPFVEPRWSEGWIAVWCGYLYASAMVVRYIVRMVHRPDQRWLGGAIPIVFHTVVAAYLWVFGCYHSS